MGKIYNNSSNNNIDNINVLTNGICKIKIEDPIPSCEIYELEFDEKNNKWTYVYNIATPKNIDVFEQCEDLYVYGHISDMKLYYKPSNPNANIKINNIFEYLDLLKLQQKYDVEFRKNFKEELQKSGKKIDKINTILLQNKNYNKEELDKAGLFYIAENIEQDEQQTIFACNKI